MQKSDLNEKTRKIERMTDVDIQKKEKYIAFEILKGVFNYDRKCELLYQLMYSS